MTPPFVFLQASKSTFEDLSFMGKHTLGDFTKTAREAAKKGGIFSKVSLKVRGTTTVQDCVGRSLTSFLRHGSELLLLLPLLLLLVCPASMPEDTCGGKHWTKNISTYSTLTL